MLSSHAIQERIKERLGRLGRPTTEKDLIKQLRLKGESRRKAREVIAEMLRRGELARTRTDRIGLAEKMDLVRGRLEMKRSGFGFVVPAEPGRTDVYVATQDLADALHGDRVLVHVDRRGEGGRPEGHIVEVLERQTTRVVGRLVVDAGGTRVVPFDPRLFYEIFIPDKALMGADPGDMVTVELTRFPSRYRAPTGRIVEVMGSVDEPGVDLQVVIAAHGLRDAFPEEVLEEAEAIATKVEETALEGREDFRDRPIVTIDGETARDFDDAVEVEVLENGNYRLGVHIADVSYYVRQGSHLDAEALLRGTSVYFPDRAIPMLPERLSNGICSLNPGVDRLVQSAIVEMTPAGRIVSRRFTDGIIRSAARMTYTEVKQILVDRDLEVMRAYQPLVSHFERMEGLYEVLRMRRQARGAIVFDRPESEVVLDESGRVVDIRAAERTLAHGIIEEFMLLANEVVASFLEKRRAPTLYRVHDPPDEGRVEKFEEFIMGLGHRLRAASEPLHPRAFQQLLSRVDGKPEERLISFVMLRAMKQAVYSEENRGHYALAARRYTHFTSPIRRYPDLVVHRILRELREQGLPHKSRIEERTRWLQDVAESASICERRADEAERELEEWKKVRFMADKVGNSYEGVVTGVTRFGLYVELLDYFIEGLVHMSALVDDYYHYHEDTHSLRGDSRGRVFRLGDHVAVRVVRVDRVQRQIDFAVEGMESARSKRSRGSSKSSKVGGRRRSRR